MGSVDSIQSSLVYTGAYMITQVLLWAVIISITPKRDMLIELSGYSRLNPILAMTLAIALLSTAGIPPLVGFLTKWYIIISAIAQGHYLCSIVALGFSVIAGFYYLRLVKTIYYEPLSPPLVIPKSVNSESLVMVRTGRAILIGGSLYTVLTTIVCPNLFLLLAYSITLDLFPCIF